MLKSLQSINQLFSLNIVTASALMLSLLFVCCSNTDDQLTEKKILSFEISSSDGAFQTTATIHQESLQITATIPSEVDLSTLIPQISVSQGARVFPSSGEKVNFQGGTVFTVTAQDGSKASYFVSLTQLSGQNEILFFQLPDLSIDGIIKENTVEVTFPFGTELGPIKVDFTFSSKAKSSIESGTNLDFSKENTITITSEIGQSKEYRITAIIEEPSQENELLSFNFPDLFQEAEILDNTISLSLPYGTDLANTSVEFTYSEKATAVIPSGSVINIFDDTTIVITSQSGQERVYDFDITYQDQETGVRGVWLTNVASDVLQSRENIIIAMENLKALNFNTVFVVAWNKTQTPHPSEVVTKTHEPLNKTDLMTRFDPARDVLQEVIEEAHKRNIKVIAWFEYGFASQFGDSNGGRNSILQAHPEWESKDASGNIAQKNNFYWMNAFHSEVQQFMTDLILEVVENYDVDGIQGDDRLPAVTSTSGYDDYTIERYMKENNGNRPPNNAKNDRWLQWRSNILSDYAEDLYAAVKEMDPKCLVTFSPSPFPFSYSEYCQDWPEWIDRDVVDMISPQLYRRDSRGFNEYRFLFNSNLSYAKNKLKIFYPGILLRIGNYIPSDQYLVDVIRHHRSQGVMGEVFFFYEGIGAKKKVFEALYAGEAIFPKDLHLR